MLNVDAFIADEIAFAPEHPLTQNLELPVLDAKVASQQEIRAIQRRDRIPGIVKRLIPLNAATAWEYWWCVPGRMLLPEDVELLQRDRVRVEIVLAKLLWLLGGYCFGNNSSWYGEREPIYDWQKILACVSSSGLRPDVVDIDFIPTAIAEVYLAHPAAPLQSNLLESQATPNYMAVAPGHWHIEFFPLQPIEGGFELQEPKPICSCQIWTGRPFIKHLQTGETFTRYDLWLSNPLDITIPSWFSIPEQTSSIGYSGAT